MYNKNEFVSINKICVSTKTSLPLFQAQLTVIFFNFRPKERSSSWTNWTVWPKHWTRRNSSRTKLFVYTLRLSITRNWIPRSLTTSRRSSSSLKRRPFAIWLDTPTILRIYCPTAMLRFPSSCSMNTSKKSCKFSISCISSSTNSDYYHCLYKCCKNKLKNIIFSTWIIFMAIYAHRELLRIQCRVIKLEIKL